MGTEAGEPPARVVGLKDCILEAQWGLAEGARLEGIDGEFRKGWDSACGGWLAARSLRERDGTMKRFLRSNSSWSCWALFENGIVFWQTFAVRRRVIQELHVCNIAYVRTVITLGSSVPQEKKRKWTVYARFTPANLSKSHPSLRSNLLSRPAVPGRHKLVNTHPAVKRS